MLPTQIVTRDYRGYAGEHALELRPLTLLFGRNNAGKSALLRALPFLAASARASGAQALDMTCPVVGRGAFDDLRWPFPNGAELPHGMGLGLRWPDGRGLDLAFAWYERKWIYVAGIRLDGEANPWHVALPPRGINADRALTFRRRHAPESKGFRARFEGLQPTNLEGDVPDALVELAERLAEFANAVQWLGASRRPRDRLAEYNELRADPRIAHDGTNIIAWLVEHPEALASINDWYQGTINARLDLQERPPVGYESMLTHLGRPELTVNLLDTGEGNIQVLPVLAALAAAEAGTGPTIVALEEPESHLHPRLQMALAERIRRVLEGEQDVRVILETHSEHLLLALQKLVLTGFARDRLGLYWVEQLADGRTIASPVEIGADGSLGPKWPPGGLRRHPRAGRRAHHTPDRARRTELRVVLDHRLFQREDAACIQDLTALLLAANRSPHQLVLDGGEHAGKAGSAGLAPITELCRSASWTSSSEGERRDSYANRQRSLCR